MTRKAIFLSAFLALAVPASALAYIEPENVLLLNYDIMRPGPRDAKKWSILQGKETAARRKREQERAFALQHPVIEEAPVEEEVMHAAAPVAPPGYMLVPVQPQPALGFPQQNLDDANLELARTMRLLSRVNQNQATAELRSVLHTSASDLAPTGAGTTAAVMTLIGCGIYVLRRSKNRIAYTV